MKGKQEFDLHKYYLHIEFSGGEIERRTDKQFSQPFIYSTKNFTKMSNKFSNRNKAMISNEKENEGFVRLPNPARFVIQLKSGSGEIAIYDRELNEKMVLSKGESVEFVLLGTAQSIKGEMLPVKINGQTYEPEIFSPFVKNSREPVPVFSYIRETKTTNRIGSFSYANEKETLREIPEVKRVSMTKTLFGMIGQDDKEGKTYWSICELELSGFNFGRWIDDLRSVNLEEQFYVTVSMNGPEQENPFKKATHKVLHLAKFQFSELSEKEGNFYVSDEGGELLGLVIDYIDNRTYTPKEGLKGQAPDLSDIGSDISSDEPTPKMS
jgi:hypothetical protein